MNIPDIVGGVYDSNVQQEKDAWICVVNNKHQGIFKYNKVIAITAVGEKLLIVGLHNVIARYDLKDIWGAWLDWTYKEFRDNHGHHQQGPRFFLEFTWKPWEWIGAHGELLKKHLSVPVNNSIWCDSSNTDGEIYTTSFEHPYLNTYQANGWLRAEHIAKQQRVGSYNFPNMP